MSLENQSVLVIGGGSGIGLALARAALDDGARVTIASSDVHRLSGAAEALGTGAEWARLDVTDEASVGAFFEASASFDHIAFTAGDWGGPRLSDLADLDLKQAEKTFGVRFWGALSVAKHGARRISSQGSLTLTNGMIAHRPRKGRAVFTAMAGAVEHLVRALAVELAPIRVNAVCPGLIRTGVWDRIPADRREADFAEMTKGQLIPRIGEPSETAEAYLYLMRGGYTTGQILHVEGGSFLGS